MKTTLTRAYVTITSTGIILLLLIVAGFTLLPVTAGNDDLLILGQTSVQIARSEFIAKEVLVLAYRPAIYHSEAVSGLQTNLPVFEQVQTGLLKGDAALGLPPNPPDDVARAVSRTNDDYQAIVAALKSILARPDMTADPIQVDIIATHEPDYSLGMYQVAALLQIHAESWKLQLLIIRMTIIGVALIAKIINYLLVTRTVIHEQTPVETKEHSTT